MRVGFDVSNLYPEMAGVYTYSHELLTHLALLDDPPEISLIDATGRADVTQLRSVLNSQLGLDNFVRVRMTWPIVHLKAGPWKEDYRTRRLAYAFDSHVVIPVAQIADQIPLVASLRLPRKAVNVDLIHWSDSAFLNIRGVPHVMTIHDTIVLRSRSWHPAADVRYHERRLRQAAKYSTRIIVDSDSTRRDVVSLLGVRPERIDVIPLAPGPTFRPPDDVTLMRGVLARYGLETGAYVIFVGTIEPRKNLVRMATAFKAAVLLANDASTKLVIAGKVGWLAEPILRDLKALGLGERLVMLGRVPLEDLPALVGGAMALAYVSLYEGFGLPPLEAMACGTPVIASNSSSIPEVVGDAGILVDPYSVKDITAALQRIFADDTLRRELSNRGLARASGFTWTKTAQMTVATYRRAIGGRP